MLAAGLIIAYGVKCHIEKKCLESAIAFLGGDPVVFQASRAIGDKQKQEFKETIQDFSKLLVLFRDGKVDEIKKMGCEVCIWGSTITVKTTVKAVADGKRTKFVVSKNNNESWNVKNYSVDGKGIEELLIEVTLKQGAGEQPKDEEKPEKNQEKNQKIPSVGSKLGPEDKQGLDVEKLEKNINNMETMLNVLKSYTGYLNANI